jgi:hypothetical protein
MSEIVTASLNKPHKLYNISIYGYAFMCYLCEIFIKVLYKPILFVYPPRITRSVDFNVLKN